MLLVWRLVPDSHFLQILTQTSARLRCVTSPAPCHQVSYWTVMTSEWHLHPPACTRADTCLNFPQPMCWAERLPAQPNSKAWTEIPKLFYNTNTFSSGLEWRFDRTFLWFKLQIRKSVTSTIDMTLSKSNHRGHCRKENKFLVFVKWEDYCNIAR